MPLKPPKNDPLRNFTFQLEIGGIARAGFSEVAGLDSTSAVIDYREGDKSTTVQRIPGLNTTGEVTLKWGVDGDRELWNWRQRIVNGEPVAANRKTVFIIMLDPQGEEHGRIMVKDAWPSKYHSSDLNAKGADVAVDTITLVHEGIF